MRGHFGGLERVLFSLFDFTTGVWTGTSSSMSNGATAGAYVARNPRSANFNYEAGAELQQQGGDKLGNILSFSTSKLGAFDIVMDEMDTDLQLLMDEGAAHTTNAEHIWVASNPLRTSPRTLGLCVQRRGVDSTGAAQYENIFIPKAQCTFRRAGGTFRGEGLVTVNVVPQFSTFAHTGQVFGSADLGLNLTDDTTDCYTIYSTYPLHVVTFKQDGADTTYNTIYKPISTVVTITNTPNYHVVNGAAVALSAITLAGEATLAAAGTAAQYAVLTYETGFVPV